MKIQAILLLALIPFISYTQNFNIASHKRIVSYSNPHKNDYSSTANIFISVDSLKKSGSDTIYYINDIMAREAGFCRNPNIVGSKIQIKSNSENILTNKSGDSIRILTNAELSQKWHFSDLDNGNYFEAQVTEKGLGNVLNLTDTLKVISLTLKDEQGNTISNKFNGKTIVLSKNYGLRKGYDFYSFPEDTLSFNLSGLSNPKIGAYPISTRDIYDFNVGDEFHIEDVSSWPPVSGYFNKERRIVLTKGTSPDNDTLIYTIQRLVYSDKYSQNIDSYSTITEDTITERYPVTNVPILNLPINGPLFLNSVSDKNNRIEVIPVPLISRGDTCMEVLIGTFATDSYYEGLGNYYYQDYLGVAQYYRTLTYYKKGTETWGTPIDFDVLTFTEDKKNSSNIIAYPNPFQETINFQFGQLFSPRQIIISDTQGKIVGQYTSEGNEFTLNNFTHKGFYIYKIYEEETEVASGKLTSF